MRCHWKWHRRSIKMIRLPLCVTSVTRNWRVTRWDIMHMCQANTQMVLRWSIMRPDNTFSPVVRSAIYNSHSTRRTIDYQCTSTMDLIMISHSSWNSSNRWTTTTTEIWKSFPPSRTKKYISNTMVFNSKTCWNWLTVLSDPSWLRHSEGTWITTNIPRLRRYCEKWGKQWNDEYIDLLTWKELIFYTLIKSYSSLNNTLKPSHEQCIDDMKGEVMPQNEYDHLMKLWNTFDIKTWGE